MIERAEWTNKRMKPAERTDATVLPSVCLLLRPGAAGICVWWRRNHYIHYIDGRKLYPHGLDLYLDFV